MKKFKIFMTIIFLYMFYIWGGMFYTFELENKYKKLAFAKADVDKNEKLDINEILTAYKSLNLDGERMYELFLNGGNSSEQPFKLMRKQLENGKTTKPFALTLDWLEKNKIES